MHGRSLIRFTQYNMCLWRILRKGKKPNRRNNTDFRLGLWFCHTHRAFRASRDGHVHGRNKSQGDRYPKSAGGECLRYGLLFVKRLYQADFSIRRFRAAGWVFSVRGPHEVLRFPARPEPLGAARGSSFCFGPGFGHHRLSDSQSRSG